MKVTVREITEAVNGTLLCGSPDQVIEHISIDSRNSEGNDIFVPIIGAKVDAHRFIANAFEVGCAATLTSEHGEMKDEAHAWIRVEDTIEALHAIGRLCRSRVALDAIGVTGSVGKTTTREMIACALSAGKKVFKTGKNYNSSVGVPITMSQMSDDYEIAVLELGMNVPGELGTISEIARLKMAVITNVGVAHIEYFGSQEAICHEKYTITRGFGEEGLLIINGDDPLLYRFRESTGYPFVLYGTEAHCEYRAENIRMEQGHYCFDYVHGEERVPVVLSVLGRHNVQNAVAALAAAELNGVPVRDAAKALSSFTGFKNRLERISMGHYTIIDDTYNASPDSMIAGVRVLSGYETKGRKIAVLSDMMELGSESPNFHRQVGEAIAAEPIDELIIVGELSVNIAEGAASKNAAYPITRMASNEAAARYIHETVKEQDVVYLKASNSMHLKEITAWLKEQHTQM
ncbi:MAG: UDP-N-acetylmuramoyl-tripeptide--D-alanyl-D-alanine ligase [Lachnospiraceae bacterium]|nr:UDP-N-acetylmuramoyl-tripeptide--D-alanyl-D-alanine ligase [Lachnospiraceae bacterium]